MCSCRWRSKESVSLTRQHGEYAWDKESLKTLNDWLERVGVDVKFTYHISDGKVTAEEIRVTKTLY
jgi:hypothetical protein